MAAETMSQLWEEAIGLRTIEQIADANIAGAVKAAYVTGGLAALNIMVDEVRSAKDRNVDPAKVIGDTLVRLQLEMTHMLVNLQRQAARAAATKPPRVN